ncbi:protein DETOXIFICATION 16-like [Prosopis cineraria]|uniref:protein DETOXIFICATION 16-like n=1 Tax=Prosopis cineraria TaxID=364024 RepID=UPI00240EC3C5|nr:protein DETOXIFICATION 16-like [Prosopis cineraria]XP_054820183.1 protein DETOXIFICATION 16-like [Prosopis cineraria]XP_054820184.1 protein DETOXIFICATION 16-like [Prosopis cineraria]
MMVLLSGLLPNPKLEISVLYICLNTASIVWMIPFGLSGAVSTRISNELGAGHPRTARLAVCVVPVMAIIEGILIGTVLILIRNIWGHAYSKEVEVVKYVATMLPILALSNFLDGLQCVLSGTAKRMWFAETWSFCQSWVIISGWDSIGCHTCFCLAHWWQGTLVGDHMCTLRSIVILVHNHCSY